MSSQDESGPGRGAYIVGMHRSGTSALARALHLLGLAAGPRAGLVAADEYNPGGYWEQGQLIAMHDAMLRACGGFASAPPELGSVDVRSDGIGAVVAGLYPDPRPFFVKDPRQCLLLSSWLEARGGRDVPILLVRDAAPVVASLVHRNGYRRDLAEALWLRYQLGALRSLAGQHCLVTRYEDLVVDPARELEVIASYLTDSTGLVDDIDPARLDAAIDSIRSKPVPMAEPARPSFRLTREIERFIETTTGEFDALPPPPATRLPIRAEAILRGRRRKLRAATFLARPTVSMAARLDRKRAR